MTESAKDQIPEEVNEEGHTDNCGTLLRTAAVMGFGPTALGPKIPIRHTTRKEQFDSSRASLLCLAMDEPRLVPEKAATVVNQHLVYAIGYIAPGVDVGSAE